MIQNIIRLQLGRIGKRIGANHGLPFTFDNEVVKLVASRCTELESGGRMIDAILTNTMLPRISEEFLLRMVNGQPLTRVHVAADDKEFTYAFD
jgi:type VI secretion system protein VasG